MYSVNDNFYIILKRVFLFLPLLVLINLVFFFFTTDADSFYKLNSFSVYYFSVSMLLGVAPWITHSLKIYIWCIYLKYKIPYLETIRIAIGSDLGAAISPTAVGGSPVRAAMLIADGVKPADSIFMSLMATVEDTLFLTLSFLVLLLALDAKDTELIKFLDPKYLSLSLFYYLAITIPVIYVLYRTLFHRFTWVRKALDWFKALTSDVLSAFKQVMQNGKIIFSISFLLNILQWFFRYVVIYTLLLSLDIQVSFFQTLLLAWFVYFAMLFVPTPGATVGAEAAFYLIFASLLSADLIGLVTFGWRFLTFYLQLTLGIILFLSTGYFTVEKRNSFK